MCREYIDVWLRCREYIVVDWDAGNTLMYMLTEMWGIRRCLTEMWGIQWCLTEMSGIQSCFTEILGIHCCLTAISGIHLLFDWDVGIHYCQDICLNVAHRITKTDTHIWIKKSKKNVLRSFSNGSTILTDRPRRRKSVKFIHIAATFRQHINKKLHTARYSHPFLFNIQTKIPSPLLKQSIETTSPNFVVWRRTQRNSSYLTAK